MVDWLVPIRAANSAWDNPARSRALIALASLDLACRDHRPSVSATLTTTTFNRSSLRWLGIGT
jgi:hypothetical protein